jgi:DNA-binding NarL/FixJ family response regulator
MSIKIILADDHALIRSGLRTLLVNELGMEVVGEAGNGEETIRLTRQLAPDIVIMDITMPGLDGIEATRQIVTEMPSVRVIALSMHANKLFVEDIFKAGASGYLLKACASLELEAAIQTVLKGEVYICPKIAGVVVGARENPDSTIPSSLNLLTAKECEVLRLVVSGKSTKEIAQLLDKSPQTVDASRRQIMQKLGIDNLADLVKYAIREGLTTL